ncbi:hypothetical protein EGI32_10835 [Ferruginibacter sp. HRS2-29]|nr:hypothetical protein [Ferruginibacter sp. HRS2-29]MCP9751466.1 hypothetical protein [Ferruginibacter sp. HRS2-29]
MCQKLIDIKTSIISKDPDKPHPKIFQYPIKKTVKFNISRLLLFLFFIQYRSKEPNQPNPAYAANHSDDSEKPVVSPTRQKILKGLYESADLFCIADYR